ncbi:hypothetical protein BKA81DRAFT_214130 [Phyllosticta paracitricarpa]
MTVRRRPHGRALLSPCTSVSGLAAAFSTLSPSASLRWPWRALAACSPPHADATAAHLGQIKSRRDDHPGSSIRPPRYLQGARKAHTSRVARRDPSRPPPPFWAIYKQPGPPRAPQALQMLAIN